MNDKTFKFILLTVITVAFVLGLSGITVANILSQGKTERQRITREYEIEQERKYNACIQRAWADYGVTWDNSCKKRGLEKGCTLPVTVGESHNEIFKYDKLNCIKIYKK